MPRMMSPSSSLREKVFGSPSLSPPTFEKSGQRDHQMHKPTCFLFPADSSLASQRGPPSQRNPKESRNGIS